MRKWRGRADGHDRWHRPARLQTTLSPAQETIVAALCRTLPLPLDGLVAVTRELGREAVLRVRLGPLPGPPPGL